MDFEELHAQLVSQDQHLLYQQRSEHIGYGKDQQLLARLSAILVEHGVPPDRVEERATMGLKKVGAAELAAAPGLQQSMGISESHRVTPSCGISLAQS